MPRITSNPLANLALVAAAFSAGCGGYEEIPTTPKTETAIVDNIPDTKPSIQLPDSDALIQKIKLGKVDSISMTYADTGMRYPFYTILLTNGNTVYLDIPEDLASRKQIGDALARSLAKNKYVTLISERSIIRDLSKALTSSAGIIIPIVALIFLIGYINTKKEEMDSDDRVIKPGGNNPQKTSVKFSDIRGNKENVKLLQDIVALLKNINKSEVKIPRGILLYGGPGTGKTIMAKAVANEAGMNFIAISGSDFIEIFAGQGARKVREVFATARKHKPCIIFIDEIDGIGKNRNGAHDERLQTVNQILAEMDGFKSGSGVMVMAATNDPESLDPALMREGRFDYKVHIANPSSIEQRADILDLYIEKKKKSGRIDDDISAVEVAKKTIGFSGAQLEAVIEQADIHAIRQGRDKICKKDIAEAINQVLLGIKSDIKPTPEAQRAIAIHEFGGHYLVARSAGVKVNEVSIIPRGKSLGHITIEPNDNELMNQSKDALLRRLVVLLGGRAGEKILGSSITVGAEDDLNKARSLLRLMLSSNMLGTTMYSYDNPDLPLSANDEEIAIKLFQAAEQTAEEIIKEFPRDDIEKLIARIFKEEEITGDAANQLGEEVIDRAIWTKARERADAFVKTQD